MNLQQLRYVREAVRRGLNLTEAARALHTSQPGISKQIKELEDELGIQIFNRRGKRFIGLTEPGRRVAEIAVHVLAEIENLRRVGKEFADEEAGSFTIATTHTQARYALPQVVTAFRRRYPRVHLQLLQGNPTAIGRMVIAGEADVAIATEALDQFPELLALPSYQWHHCVVTPPEHPLLDSTRLRLEEVARHPLITYSPEFAGRSHIDQAFAAKGIEADIVLAAVDSDVIKSYVELGLGVGVIAAMAFDPERDRGLRAIDAGHLFGTNTTRIAVRRGAYLRGYVYDFIERFAPQLTRKAVDQAMAGAGETYEL
ncbi:MAG TPA: CysB family HTH-type transcriptional regulator [Burkholderiales bacterium]|nr:CysB family HTH-type transcriptional regulator [Burkholderiales bacterium]